MTAYTGQRVRRAATLAERLAFYSTPSASGCVEWTGSTDGKLGYGKLRWAGRMQYAHRLAWVAANGPVPDALVVRHRCDNPRCVHVAHLELGTHKDNVGDQFARGRARRLQGELHPLARVTDAEAADIRLCVARGETQASVARRYRISGTSVWRIVNHITHRTKETR